MNRIELKFNGRLIFGISAEIDRPNNTEELKSLVDEISLILKDTIDNKGTLITAKEFDEECYAEIAKRNEENS